LETIDASDAWDAIGTLAPVDICIIDSGTDCNHPDLKDNCADGFNVLTGMKGIIASSDDNGHGTRVAGMVAASNDNTGVVGVDFTVSQMGKQNHKQMAYCQDSL